jgi:UTP:GlnB (protein PII) uridylyltransferase
MPLLSLLPIAGPEEVDAFLRRVPIVIDRRRFTELVLGFPRRYLEVTPGVEAVRHYALMNSLASRPVVSSLARDGSTWRICIVARDRTSLFSRIAGSLSCSGLNIVSAEAFANSNSLVLDTFSCVDREGQFEMLEARRRFQAFLEDAVAGSVDLEARLSPRLPGLKLPPGETLDVELDDDAHPTATRLQIASRDFFGLLFLISRALSEARCNIEMAYIETPGQAARDAFFLTRNGGKLTDADKREVRERLSLLSTSADAKPVDEMSP